MHEKVEQFQLIILNKWPMFFQVKVMLKICTEGSHSEQAQSCLSIDPRKKQVTVFDPSTVGVTLSSHRRTTPVAPKMFAFDAVFSPDDSQVNWSRCFHAFIEFVNWCLKKSLYYQLDNNIKCCTMYQIMNFHIQCNDLLNLIVTSNLGYQEMASACHFSTSVRGMKIENCLSMSVFVMQIS